MQIQLDKLGIDYPERRNALIEAVTLADAKRVAKRLLDTKMLTVVVGRAQGLSTQNQRSAKGHGTFRPQRSQWCGMPFPQDIDSARAEKIGTHGVTQAALDEALRRCEAALAWLRKRHADRACRCCDLPATTDDLDEIGKAAARLRAGATDVVVLGTGGSSLGGQTLAQLADVGVRGREAFRAPVRACISSIISIP